MDNQTVVINLFGGPGAGKSTCAMEICSELKKHGLSADYVQEYAKELVYENHMDLLDGSREHQQLLFEEQKRRVNILLGKVDFIVTDSPVILSAIYNKELTPDFEQQVLKEFNKNRNFNIFINRGKTFESNGRIHNLDESIEIDNQLKEYLEQNQIYYGEYQHDTISKAVNNIQDYVTEQKINSISNQRNKKEEIDRIIQEIKQKVRIEEIAPRYGLTLVKIGSYLTSKEHDSLRIDVAKQKFWHNSQLTGGDVIDFVRYFGNVDFGGAVEQLKSIANISNDIAYIQPPAQSSLGRTVPTTLNTKEFILPEKDNNNKNVFAYLTQTRKINADIVNDLINSNHLFQDVHKNCVFVGYNENQKPVFANQRGTNTEKKFVADVVNSNYNECFYLNHNSNKLIVAESVIDVLSIATIIAATQGEYQNYNYLALSGTTKRQSIFHHLEQQPEIDTLILSLDNDKAGELASQKVKEQLQEMEWTGSITDYTSVLKDWNEDLQKGIYARVPHCLSQEEVQKEIEHICDDVDDFDI